MSVKFLHIRNYIENSLGGSLGVSCKGGTTVAFYANDHGGWPDVVTFAIAKCSDRDNYNRKIGRTIAEGRLLKNHNVVTCELNDRKPIQAILEYLYD